MSCADEALVPVQNMMKQDGEGIDRMLRYTQDIELKKGGRQLIRGEKNGLDMQQMRSWKYKCVQQLHRLRCTKRTKLLFSVA